MIDFCDEDVECINDRVPDKNERKLYGPGVWFHIENKHKENVFTKYDAGNDILDNDNRSDIIYHQGHKKIQIMIGICFYSNEKMENIMIKTKEIIMILIIM